MQEWGLEYPEDQEETGGRSCRHGMAATAQSPMKKQELPHSRRAFAIAAISLGTTLAVIDGAVAAVALPTIAEGLRIDHSAAVLIVTVYQIVLLMTLLPCSALADRVGHRRLYWVGQALFTAGSLLTVFADNLNFLLAMRALQALGASASLSVTTALIRSIYPPTRLGRGLGVHSIVVATGSAVGPTIGGLILSVADWTWVFAAAAPFGILSLLLARWLPRSVPRPGRFDGTGALLCAATFGLLFGTLESAVRGASAIFFATIGALGVAAAVTFVKRELRAERPILPFDLLSSTVMALSIGGALSAHSASMVLFLSAPFRLQQYGFAPSEVGALIACWPIAMMIVAPLAGILSDKVPAGLLGGMGMALATVAFAGMAFLPDQPSYFHIAFWMGMCGAGFGLFLPPNARLIIGSAPHARAASAGGLLATTRLTGQALAASLVAALLGAGLGPGMAPVLIAAALTLAASLCSLARLNPAIREPVRTEVMIEGDSRIQD
jgi:DHA2 family multidrug resistance protein-like MFS transporter